MARFLARFQAGIEGDQASSLQLCSGEGAGEKGVALLRLFVLLTPTCTVTCYILRKSIAETVALSPALLLL